MKNKEQELQELKAKAYDLIANYEVAIGVAENYKKSLNEVNAEILKLQQEDKETE
jgi:aspartyl-tRNA synthetase